MTTTPTGALDTALDESQDLQDAIYDALQDDNRGSADTTQGQGAPETASSDEAVDDRASDAEKSRAQPKKTAKGKGKHKAKSDKTKVAALVAPPTSSDAQPSEPPRRVRGKQAIAVKTEGAADANADKADTPEAIPPTDAVDATAPLREIRHRAP